MGVFDRLGQQAEAPQQTQITPDMMRREIGTISSDPASYLSRRGFSIPDGMTDPKDITTYLLRSGQIGGGRLQQVLRMLGVPGMNR